MAERHQRTKHTLKRTLNFVKIFFLNKRALIGVIIILFFIFMALGAPLLTPYDPFQQMVSGTYAAPTWLKSLPAFLGGNPDLSENFQAPNTSSFSQEVAGWHLTQDSTNISDLQVETGFGPSVNSGSIAVRFERNVTGVLTGVSNASVRYDFYYPYSGVPDRFVESAAIFVNGTAENVTLLKYFLNFTTGEFQSVATTQQLLIIVPKVHLFLQRLSDGKKWNIFPSADTQTATWPLDGSIATLTEDWLTAKQDSNTLYKARDVFPNAASGTGAILQIFQGIPGNFALGIDISFVDALNSTVPAETTVYVSPPAFFGYGKSWGLLGTDELGRDLWSQLVYGSRISLIIGLVAAIIGIFLGLVVGLASGFLGAGVDEVLMRFTDLLLVIPFLPLMMVLVSILGASLENLVLVIGFLGWMGFARVIRSQVLSVKERPFIEAAKSVGAGRTHIIVRHILPNVMSLVYVSLAMAVPGAITTEAALSFLGFYDPTRMSWGRMLNSAFFTAGNLSWWWVIVPGLCIALLAMAFILLGFALDDILNPRLRLRR
jgi:peptide/nickel transport system permease protein